MYRDVGVRRMPRGLRQIALSISCLSPIVSRPDAFAVPKIASLILRPERQFLAVTSFQSRRRPSLSFGSSSLISLRRQSLSLSRARLRPPGNIQSPSRFRLTRSTRPRFAATSFEDFAIPYKHHLSIEEVQVQHKAHRDRLERATGSEIGPPQVAASFMTALTTGQAAHGLPRPPDDLRCYRRSPRRPTPTQAVRF
jgi:hypothetical protein